MRPLPLVLLVLLLAVAVPTFAQNTDLSVSLEAATEGPKPANRVAVGQDVGYVIRYHGIVPAIASDVALEFDASGVVTQILSWYGAECTNGDPVRCTFGADAEANGFLQVTVRIDKPGVQSAVARLVHQGSSSDPDPFNNTATHTFEAVALPLLELRPHVYVTRLEPGERGSFLVAVQNRAATPATNVALTVSFPAGGVATGLAQGNAPCATANNGTLVCTAPSLGQDQSLFVNVAFTAPARMDGNDFVIDMKATSDELEFDSSTSQATVRVPMVQQFVVTNVGDEGFGSLRQAIHDVNSLCPVAKPCAILFRIPAPVPESGWFTIQPRTPLPEIVATVKIDGNTQTVFTGDTNKDGPEIEINGALVREHSGLRLRPNCDVNIRNLAVNGFPLYGIEIHRQFEGFDSDPCLIDHSLRIVSYVTANYLGTDPRGRMAKPNLRGLGIFTVYSIVTDNVISGNLRAGIYSTNSNWTVITQNRIGIGTDGSPLGNGAGIFFDMGDPLLGIPGGADVVENVIAHNQGMAVGRTRRGEIFIRGNSMFDNLLQGIDVDLDAATPNRDDDTDVPNRPVLVSAAYDPVQNATVIRGRLDSNAVRSSVARIEIEVYASSRLSVWGYPQAERRVGQVALQSGHQDFEIVVPGDLRGQWITAANTVSHYVGWVTSPRTLGTQSHRDSFPGDTSELSEALPVQ